MWLMVVLSFSAANLPDTTPVKGGRGLAPDSGGPVDTFLTEAPPSGASPLPHWISICQDRPSMWLMVVLSFSAANLPDTTPVKGGRGLAPDSCGPVDTFLTEAPPSGASPLPHWISICQDRPSMWLMVVLSFSAANLPDTTPVKGGRGLAPDSCGPVDTFLTEAPPSGASPLPHWISICQDRPSMWLMVVLSFSAANLPDTTPVKGGRVAPSHTGSLLVRAD